MRNKYSYWVYEPYFLANKDNITESIRRMYLYKNVFEMLCYTGLAHEVDTGFFKDMTIINFIGV